MIDYELSDVILSSDMEQDFSTGYGYISDVSEQDWHSNQHSNCDGYAYYDDDMVKCGYCNMMWHTPTSYRKAQIDAGQMSF